MTKIGRSTLKNSVPISAAQLCRLWPATILYSGKPLENGYETLFSHPTLPILQMNIYKVYENGERGGSYFNNNVYNMNSPTLWLQWMVARLWNDIIKRKNFFLYSSRQHCRRFSFCKSSSFTFPLKLLLFFYFWMQIEAGGGGGLKSSPLQVLKWIDSPPQWWLGPISSLACDPWSKRQIFNFFSVSE